MNCFWSCFSSSHVHQGLGNVGLKLRNEALDQDVRLEGEGSKELSSKGDRGYVTDAVREKADFGNYPMWWREGRSGAQ